MDDVIARQDLLVGAQSRVSSRFWTWMVLLLAAAMLARVPLLPRLGHAYDQDAYRAWMGAIQDHGLAQVFERTDTDYVGYHYILWALGEGYGKRASQVTVRDKSLRVWLKVPGIAGDLLAAVAVAVVTRGIARSRPGRLDPRWRRLGERLGLEPADATAVVCAGLFLFHPAVLYAGSYWGQQDSLVAFFMLIACWLAWRRLPVWAAVALAAGTIVKPQPLTLVPVLAWLVWCRSGWPGLVRGALAGAAVLAIGHIYFVATGNGGRMLDIYLFQVKQTEHLSFAAYNLWWPMERLAGARPDTAIVTLGALRLTYGMLASVLVVAALVLTWWALRGRRRALDGPADAETMLLGAGYFLAAYFLVAAGAHERYALPALIFLLPALPFTPRLRLPLLLFSVAIAMNLLIGLPLDRRWHQGDPVWLTYVVSVMSITAVAGLTFLIPFRGATSAGAPRSATT